MTVHNGPWGVPNLYLVPDLDPGFCRDCGAPLDIEDACPVCEPEPGGAA